MSTDLLDPPADTTTTTPPPTAFDPTEEFPASDAVSIPLTALTWDGFLAWMESDAFPERGRISFLGSTIEVDMSPGNLPHGTLKLELYRVLGNIVHDEHLGRFHIDGVRLRNAAAMVSHQPDGMFVTHISLVAGRVGFSPTADGTETLDLTGTPDLVIEIVSPSSVKKDKRTLRELYHRAGIPEYWLIDARGSGIEFQLLRHAPAGYVPATADADGFAPSAAFGRSFALTRLRDEYGQWAYTLHVRPTA